MAFTLEDLLNAPQDEASLRDHLVAQGHIPAPPAPATLGAITPRDRALMVGATAQPVVPPARVAPLVPPSITTGTATPPPAGIVAPMVRPTAPTGPRPFIAPTLEALPATRPLPAGPGATFVPPVTRADLANVGEFTPPAAPAAPAAGLPGAAPPPIKLTPPTRKESEAAGRAEYLAGRPQITAKPGTPEYDAQQLAQDEYDRRHPLGADISRMPGTRGKILHTLGVIGNVAGTAVAPGVMATIPGTALNRQIRMGAAAEDLPKQLEARSKLASEESARQTAELQRKNVESEIEHREQIQLEKDTNGNITGYRDKAGALHGLDEPGTPQGVKDIAEATTAKAIKPSIEKMDNGDIVAVTPGVGGAPPTSKVVYHGDPKVETEVTQRTVGGQEHKILINKKTGEDIKDLGAFKTEVSPAQAMKEEKQAEEWVLASDAQGKNQELMSRGDAKAQGKHIMGTQQPGEVDKAKTHHTVLNTLQTQLNTVVASSDALNQGIIQRAIIARCLAHPTNSVMDSATRALALTGATEKTQDYVQAVLALREAGLGLPKEITGGSRVSEIQASALWATMPGAESLNQNYAIKQAKKFQSDIDRLRDRAPGVRGMMMVDPDERLTAKGTVAQRTTAGGAAAAPAPAAGAGAAGGGPTESFADFNKRRKAAAATTP